MTIEKRPIILPVKKQEEKKELPVLEVRVHDMLKAKAVGPGQLKNK